MTLMYLRRIMTWRAMKNLPFLNLILTILGTGVPALVITTETNVAHDRREQKLPTQCTTSSIIL
ncbi:hypothetical protein BCR42DRAFT_429618 [Absidia repens]|uniref:Uncharacterized protein n=1 Tax=Absidia repens TaxID=90262 RepID=A0A1X2HR74_9FUNG|nr:hypothetical protein BCR42DRAFT_429618 [Absidia repens]